MPVEEHSELEPFVLLQTGRSGPSPESENEADVETKQTTSFEEIIWKTSSKSRSTNLRFETFATSTETVGSRTKRMKTIRMKVQRAKGNESKSINQKSMIQVETKRFDWELKGSLRPADSWWINEERKFAFILVCIYCFLSCSSLLLLYLAIFFDLFDQ